MSDLKIQRIWLHENVFVRDCVSSNWASCAYEFGHVVSWSRSTVYIYITDVHNECYLGMHDGDRATFSIFARDHFKSKNSLWIPLYNTEELGQCHKFIPVNVYKRVYLFP